MPNVLITGCSWGIGQATVLELASRGWFVFASMRNPAKSTALEKALEEAGLRAQVRVIQIDVTDPASIHAGVDKIRALTGDDLSAVVHNAGIAVGGAFEDLADRDVRAVMETNFFGVLELTRALLPVFRLRQRGRVVLISSDCAFAGGPGNAIYCASKWALEGWAESISYELAFFGIEVVLVEPGPCRTQIWENSPRRAPSTSAYVPWLQRLYRAADEHVARSARDPKEVAHAVLRALESGRPSFRYPVGPLSRIGHFAKGKVPSNLLRQGVTRYLGLHRIHH